MTTPTVSIVILTYNRKNSLKKCLDSVFKQSCQDFEVIVLDKGSTDGTKDLVGKYPIKYFIENNGLVAAYNRGINESKGKIVAPLDDDVILDSNWLTHIIETYNQEENIGAVGGRQLVNKTQFTQTYNVTDDSSDLESQIGGILGNLSRLVMLILIGQTKPEPYKMYGCGFVFLGGLKETGKIIPVDIINVNMTFRKDILKKVNGVDPIYNVGHGDYSETDLCFKIKNIGYKIVINPKALLLHEVSVKGVPRGMYERMRNFVYFCLKWKNTIRTSKLDSPRFSLYLFFRSLFLIYISKKPKEVISGIIDGWKLYRRTEKMGSSNIS